jgi:hypothetical protein
MRRTRALLALLLVLAAACSKGSAPSTPVTNTIVASTAPSINTSTSTATTVAPSTTPASTSTTSASATAASTTTSTVPADQAVSTAYTSYVAGYWVCLRAPNACDASTLTAAGSSARQNLTKTVSDLRNGKLHIGADDVGYTVIESVVIDPVSQRATVVTCNWDTAVLYGPPIKDGEPEVVVNNKQSTSRLESVLYLDAGVWKLGEERRIERVEGTNTCPPAS